MSRNLPSQNIPALEWLEARMSAWSGSPTAIGLTALQVSAMQTHVTTARTAYSTAQTVRAASKAATLDFHNKAGTMKREAAELISVIKAFAATSGNPAVYALADLSPADPPSPAGEPEAPTNLRGAINSDGAVELAWDGSLAQGTFFEVSRRVEGQAAFTRIDAVGEKKFTDETVPAGFASVYYTVRAKRGSLVSSGTDPIQVRFGIVPESEGLAEGGGLALAA